MSKIISIDEVVKKVDDLKKTSKKIVLLHGCFDILHEGHLELFKKAKKLGVVFVGIDDDESVREIKGETRPVNLLERRIQAIKKEDLVNFIFVLSPKESSSYSSYFKNLYKRVSPDFLVTADGEFLQKRKKDLKRLGIKLIVMKKKVI